MICVPLDVTRAFCGTRRLHASTETQLARALRRACYWAACRLGGLPRPSNRFSMSGKEAVVDANAVMRSPPGQQPHSSVVHWGKI